MALLTRKLPPAVEALLEPREDMSEEKRSAALAACGFVGLYSTEYAHRLAKLGARLARIKPSMANSLWPLSRATLGDGYARFALQGDVDLLAELDNAVRRVTSVADAVETVCRLHGADAALRFLEAQEDIR